MPSPPRLPVAGRITASTTFATSIPLARLDSGQKPLPRATAFCEYETRSLRKPPVSSQSATGAPCRLRRGREAMAGRARADEGLAPASTNCSPFSPARATQSSSRSDPSESDAGHPDRALGSRTMADGRLKDARTPQRPYLGELLGHRGHDLGAEFLHAFPHRWIRPLRSSGLR